MSAHAITTNLPQDLTSRLAKVLGMLGSHHDGEVLSAARKAHEIVKGADLTWHDVLMTTPRLPSPASPIEDDDHAEVRFAEALLGHPALNDWEFIFLTSIAKQLRRGRPLTTKQTTKLKDTFNKYFGN